MNFNLCDQDVQHYLLKGLTPRRLEDAYKFHRVYGYLRSLGMRREEAAALRERWGMDERPEFKCPECGAEIDGPL